MNRDEIVEEMKNAFISQVEWMDNSITTGYFTDWWDENDWPPSKRD